MTSLNVEPPETEANTVTVALDNDLRWRLTLALDAVLRREDNSYGWKATLPEYVSAVVTVLRDANQGAS